VRFFQLGQITVRSEILILPADDPNRKYETREIFRCTEHRILVSESSDFSYQEISIDEYLTEQVVDS